MPRGVEVMSTYVEDGQYQYCKDKIFYFVPIIKPNSFCKIVLNVRPITLGEKINSIEVLGKKSNYTIHNNSKECGVVYLKQKGKREIGYVC